MADPTATVPSRPRRPNPVLTILVHPDCWELEPVKAWREAGHRVRKFTSYLYEVASDDVNLDPTIVQNVDVFLGPNCHFFTAALDKHGEEVLKWARKRRKESKQR